MKGLVVSVKYSVYAVMCDGVIFNVPARGLFKKEKFRIAVGDYVDLDDEKLVIRDIYSRKSELIRPCIANIDQILIVLSIKEPEFSPHLALKYLTYANANNIPSYLIITKVDTEKELSQYRRIAEDFEKLGIKVLPISNKNNVGIKEVSSLFSNNITVLIGQSGVGKSSILNSIDEKYERQIGEYSVALGRGKHETKEVILLPYNGGYIADTPGFSSLDLNLSRIEIARYFPGFDKYFGKCFFSNCLHMSEKNCAIKAALENNEIDVSIYNEYIKLLSESEKKL
ncbi:MAG: ribosome small subunit-dependent GTPase A [Bacilli bacterium]|nr:ribosome small subunit-dependent GTPase A [Bacilli bacterium]